MREKKILRDFVGQVPGYLRLALEQFARENQRDFVPVSFELTCEVAEHPVHPANDATGYSHEEPHHRTAQDGDFLWRAPERDTSR